MDEEQQIQKIARDYFASESNSPEEIETLMANLLAMAQEDGVKLVHLGNVLFLVIVRGEGIVEIHTIGNGLNPTELAKNFVDLAKYLKNIEVKTAYTYTEDNRFSRLAKMTGLPVKQFKADVEGKPMNVYVMEF
jgi:hypothetical protein